MHNCKRKKRTVRRKGVDSNWRRSRRKQQKSRYDDEKCFHTWCRISSSKEVETSGVKCFRCWLLSKFHIKAVLRNDMNLQLCGCSEFGVHFLAETNENRSWGETPWSTEFRNICADWFLKDFNWRINAEISQQQSFLGRNLVNEKREIIIERNGKCESLKNEWKLIVVLMNVRSIKSKVYRREQLKFDVE
jgi:hypothetical protein